MGTKSNHTMSHFDSMSKKSAWAALATLGITAVAAGATAFIKYRKKRRQQAEAEALEHQLSADQEMVYNEAVRSFLSINDRIYELRQQRMALQPLIEWLATDGEKPEIKTDDENLLQLSDDIQKFLITQVPFINACISTMCDDGTTYSDYVRGRVGNNFDSTLDQEYAGAKVEEGTPIKYVLKLGYCFPNSRIATLPVKSIILV